MTNFTKEEIKTIDEIIESIQTETVRKDLVYTLLIKAWDLGFYEGTKETQEQYRAHAEY